MTTPPNAAGQREAFESPKDWTPARAAELNICTSKVPLPHQHIRVTFEWRKRYTSKWSSATHLSIVVLAELAASTTLLADRLESLLPAQRGSTYPKDLEVRVKRIIILIFDCSSSPPS